MEFASKMEFFIHHITQQFGADSSISGDL